MRVAGSAAESLLGETAPEAKIHGLGTHMRRLRGIPEREAVLILILFILLVVVLLYFT